MGCMIWMIWFMILLGYCNTNRIYMDLLRLGVYIYIYIFQSRLSSSAPPDYLTLDVIAGWG